MHLRGDNALFFATDLTNFLGCRHLTTLERFAAQNVLKRPFFDDPMLEILRERGLAHERAYIEHLADLGKRIVEIRKHSPTAFEDTLAAMQEGADVIVQARLAHGSWAGWADVLLRVDAEPGAAAAWLYEPVETKLAKETRAATLVQLCLYAELLAEMQGTAPVRVGVVRPGTSFEVESYRFAEFRSYFRLIRRQFEAEVAAPLSASVEAATPYPDPVAHCDICNWYAQCDARRQKDDHLSLVAGIRKDQRKELGAWGVATLADLAALPLPLTRKPAHGSAASLVRVREQARVQLEARTSGLPVYELLPRVKDEGLAGLPAPSGLDVFLDLEGDRLAEGGGLDYLFGYAYRDETGAAQYEAIWALSPAGEKAAFERLMDLVTERRARDATMHVYHYAPYEPTSMKRLMGRYATRADELDALLRSGAFVDLYGIVRKALRAGIDSYSIKKLEPFYGLAREVDLRRVSRQLRAVEYAIAKHDAQSLSADVLDDVRGYNRDDCVSAMDLRGWLEQLREEAGRADGGELGRPATPTVDIKQDLKERLERIRVLADALTEHVPDEGRSRAQQAQWLLAQLLEWHRREDKVMYSEFFRLNKMNVEELLDARAGLSGLEFLERVTAKNRGVAVDRYTFPQQDTLFEDGAEAYRPGGELAKFATVVSIDLEKRTVDLQKPAKVAGEHPDALFVHDIVQNKDAVLALMRLAEDVLRTGLDTASTHRAERDLLLRNNPRLLGGAPFQVPGEATFDAAGRVVLALDGSVLAIQGPPGAGKTHAGAQMIVDLVRNGRSVGVTAGSHKVIRNLLDKVVELACAGGPPLRCMHRVAEKSENESPHVHEEADSKKGIAKIVAHEFPVVGATAWVWSKEEVAGAVDVLFVDEAGQMSLANVLACAQGARNLVLLGDPQQLEQPQKASHPEGADLSALEYLLEGHETMPAERGLFLGETWRLHPEICRFTSEQFYEGKLRSKPGLERQVITGPTRFAGSGLFYVPVEHEGNHNTSPEEAASVAEVVAELIAEGVTWTNASGEVGQMRLEDVLIVAPYNAQVSEIAARLPGARVGTVDKFQGQEAPVVIYSMATSNPEDAPHGMGFLFSRHRLNVATSRARCVCILVGTPRLFEPECRTPEQMRLANAFCAYLERARRVPPRIRNRGDNYSDAERDRQSEPPATA